MVFSWVTPLGVCDSPAVEQRVMDYSNLMAPPVPPHKPMSPRPAHCQGRLLKCVFLGDGAVGKTSLIVSYTTNGYPTKYVPTAFDDFSAVVQVDEQPVRLQLCDTAGQDEFDKLRHFCYTRTDVLLLCFSVVSPTSFQNIGEKWVPEIRRRCPLTPVLLVGTQCDLRQDVKVLIELARRRERPVLEEDARALADKIGAVAYIECSSLTQKNLKEVFDAAISVGLRHSDRRARRERKGKILLLHCKQTEEDNTGGDGPGELSGRLKMNRWSASVFG
ncbi:rho-related GTP-binding protein RhoU-like isoform X1 [Sinocyclocheilus rhinocerous]|uniref:Rho-related GTP-binding protein RhoU-like n=1 Tax=Sinocyclocheilus rhinocerous TaxID=307959 RepID=A0A673GAG5_9TELE|nr:PREDICTED: rho-related GTP-binding protein RhoU-like isoform X1 [Sinocyclocheilus rhinocerous]